MLLLVQDKGLEQKGFLFMWTERCSILESSQQALTSKEKEPCPGLSLLQFPILHNACCPQDSTDLQPHLKQEPTGVTSLNCQHLP